MKNMSFDGLTDSISEKKLTEKGLDFSIFAVLEPINYNMKLENIIFSDLTFMFLSTSAKLRHEIAVFCDTFLEPKTDTDNLFDETVDLKEWIESVSSQGVTTNSPFLRMLLEVYLELALITSSLSLSYYESIEHFFEEAFKNGMIRYKSLLDNRRINGEIDEEIYGNLFQNIKKTVESEKLVKKVKI